LDPQAVDIQQETGEGHAPAAHVAGEHDAADALLPENAGQKGVDDRSLRRPGEAMGQRLRLAHRQSLTLRFVLGLFAFEFLLPFPWVERHYGSSSMKISQPHRAAALSAPIPPGSEECGRGSLYLVSLPKQIGKRSFAFQRRRFLVV